MLVEALSHGFVAGIRDVPYASTWSNVLRLLPAPANELPRRACTSKRAMVSMLKSAERFGFVVVDDGIAHLTDAGRAVDPGWGPAGCEPLAALVSQLELEHPHHVVPYGTADGSMTGGPGVDWKPVPRQSSDVAGLPMTALLSQALTAFAIEYERDHIGPISWAANLLPQLVDDGVPFVSKPGTHTLKNMARVGVVSVEGSWARPTPLGRAMRDAYAPLCARIEVDWRERYGSSLIDEVIAAVDVAGDDLPPFPLVHWTGGEFIVLGNDL